MLVVICNMESGAVSMNFLYCYIKAHWSCALNECFTHDFITSSISHLESISSLSYADIPNVDTFHVYYQSLHSLTSLPVSS